MTVLDEFRAYPAVMARELDRYLPFLATTKILDAATRRGVGREKAHEVIQEHAVAVALTMREKATAGNDLFDRLAADPRLRAHPGRDRRRWRRTARRSPGRRRHRSRQWPTGSRQWWPSTPTPARYAPPPIL